MNHLAATENPFRSLSVADARQIRESLVDLDAVLGRITGSADQDFLNIGHTLGHAVDVFGRLGGNLTGLAEQLNSQDAQSTVDALEQAVRDITRMSGGEGNAAPILAQLEDGAAEVAKGLDVLRKIISEIGGLAINGKIQAALVSAAGVDFSVFTTEIGRLGTLAATSTEQAAERLTTVRQAVASARQGAADFERNEARELDAVQARIQASLSALVDRRRRAAIAADSVGAKSTQTAQRIAKTVAELQINDSVCQRIEHVRTAVRAMADLVGGDTVTEPGCQWLNETAEAERMSLVGGVCHLQAAQLHGGAADYRREVDGLISNLSALAGDAGAILSEAEDAFGGSGGGLFLAEIQQDIRRATELLGIYAAARRRAESVVEAVSEGFRAMAGDLEAIQSIDADMRVMGLNATLKCGRLGNEGRALGVVAHELRACSKRTEDCSHGIAGQLTSVLALADSLAAVSASIATDAARDPIGIMSASMAALEHMGGAMSSILETLRSDAGGVSRSLGETATGIDIHHRVGAVADEGTARLSSIAGRLIKETDLSEEQHQVIHRLMQPCYTMDRERIVHQTFAKDESAATAPQLTAANADDEDDLDALFL
ncbi:MAG TPA: hypothetical protein VM661_11800 [Candidatus Sulfotelmatobacter sp.]|jgi:hypothetical protein|nr:hypothetical protein [Candidatus Sulfotelmatobacter sp.]